MKKRLQGILMGFILTLTLTNSLVYAKTGESIVKVVYSNIKVYVDGSEVVPKDANNKIVEPFIMNGTTYLPVRAVGNALKKEVMWDGATKSVYLGKEGQNKPDNYLDRLQYSNYITGATSNKFTRINGKITDFLKTDYTNGMLFYFDSYNSHREIKDDRDGANTKIAYPLNSQYRKLSGKIVLPKSLDGKDIRGATESNSATVYFYGDGKLIHTANSVTGSMPFDFDINVSGVNTLEIKLKGNPLNFHNSLALTDLALYK